MKSLKHLAEKILVRRVITNDHSLTKSAYSSRTFLKILAVPSNAAFCNSPIFVLISNWWRKHMKFLRILPRAPITIGTTCTFFCCHSLLTSLRRSWYLSIFSFSFLFILQSLGIAISTIKHFSPSCAERQCQVNGLLSYCHIVY